MNAVEIEIEDGKVLVTGRNGYYYAATPLSGKFHIVGKFIVVVEDGHCKQTVCKATKANVKKFQ